MGYRGSKSVGWLTRIGWYYWKEQRIYSGTYKKISIFYIRYILTDFERNCQIINLFYQRNKQNKLYSLYATELLNNGQDANKENLSWFITGFCDGEGSFSINVIKNKKYKTGFQVTQSFRINLHVKDSAVLVLIQKILKVGKIYKTGTVAIFQVSSISELETIIAFFDKYPLITKKRADYELLKQAIYIIEKKEHLTMEGLCKIIAIRASMNRGLSPKLAQKVDFTDIVSVKRPLVLDEKIVDPYWLAGFTSAEGSFMVKIFKSNASKMGVTVRLVFQLSQHQRDEQLMKSFIYYLVPPPSPLRGGEGRGTCGAPEGTPRWTVVMFIEIEII